MYVCNDCDCCFDEPGTRVEKEIHTELDDRPYEYFYFRICPECGSDDFEEAPTCEYCQGQYSKADMVTKHFCVCCMGEIVRDRHDMLEGFAREWAAAFDEYLMENLNKLCPEGDE